MRWARQHPRIAIGLAIFVVLIVIGAAAGGSTKKTAKTTEAKPAVTQTSAAKPTSAKPSPGSRRGWSVLLDCLRSHPLFAPSVTNGGKHLILFDQVSGSVGNFDDDGSHGAAVKDAKARNDASSPVTPSSVDYNWTAGPIVYMFTPGTSAQNRSDIRACVTQAYGSAGS